jgi:hypothetical protein
VRPLGQWHQFHLLDLVRRLGQWRRLHLLDLVGQLAWITLWTYRTHVSSCTCRTCWTLRACWAWTALRAL